MNHEAEDGASLALASLASEAVWLRQIKSKQSSLASLASLALAKPNRTADWRSHPLRGAKQFGFAKSNQIKSMHPLHLSAPPRCGGEEADLSALRRRSGHWRSHPLRGATRCAVT